MKRLPDWIGYLIGVVIGLIFIAGGLLLVFAFAMEPQTPLDIDLTGTPAS